MCVGGGGEQGDLNRIPRNYLDIHGRGGGQQEAFVSDGCVSIVSIVQHACRELGGGGVSTRETSTGSPDITWTHGQKQRVWRVCGGGGGQR